MEDERFKTVEDLINNDRFCEWVYNQKHERFWQHWQENNPEKQPIVKEAISFLQQFSFEHKNIESKEIELSLENVWSNINIDTEFARIISPKKNNPRSIFLKRISVAATLLMLLVGGWLISNYFTSPYAEYSTQYAETKTITLPDNSTVILQANSHLKTPKKWVENEDRQVWLKGQAFFSVTKIKTYKPIKFEVKTTDFTVEVLGTEFDVLNRSHNKRVVLQEGNIRMKWDNKREMNLKPNEMVAFTKKMGRYKKSNVKSEVFTAWTKKQLILNNTPLFEIARIFKDDYGYEVKFSPLVNQEQTRSTLGVINITSMDNLIKVMEASYEVTITKKDQLIEIR